MYTSSELDLIHHVSKQHAYEICSAAGPWLDIDVKITVYIARLIYKPIYIHTQYTAVHVETNSCI